jgi:hypothetical protein
MKTYKLIVIIIVVSVTIAGITIYSIKKTKLEKRLLSVSDAGYETAYDILYPLKSQRSKRGL